MLKSISAALLAVSVLAAPAFAASEAKTAPAPVTKSAQAPVAKTTATTTTATTTDKTTPVIKAEQVKAKPAVLNANAGMGRHHVRHAGHHRFHKHVGAGKTHSFSKVSSKHITPAIKRG
jgi:hypothetical protein